MDGRIKLHRKILDNPIASNGALIGFLCYLLLSVSHKQNEFYLGYEKIKQNPGEGIISQKKLSKQFGVSIGTISRRLGVLKAESIIETKTSNKYTVVKVLNRDKYQGDGKQTENKMKTKGKQSETINNVKNVKNEKKEINFGFDDEIENLIKEYNKQRKKKLEKLTEAGIELFKKKLKKLGKTHKGMIAVLEQSIVNGWEGLFELKTPVIDYEDIETFGREMRKDYEGTKAKVGKKKFFELKSKWIEYKTLNNK